MSACRRILAALVLAAMLGPPGAIAANQPAPTPAQFMAGLPTTMPSTVGAAWNNGGLLSIVQP